LTPAGALMADWAKDVLTAAQTLDAGIASLRTGRDGRLRVASSLTVAEQLLPKWLVQLAASLPDTAVSLSAINSADVATAVLRGDADLGFVEGSTLATGLQGRVVARDRLVVIVPPDHPWARRRRPLPRRNWPRPGWSAASRPRAPGRPWSARSAPTCRWPPHC
jgi:DNA-binding transcriptional LysR family regulator